MKKLNVAIIGQGRSGKDIHGAFFRTEANTYYTVKYVVDYDEVRRKAAEEIHPGCTTFADYRELFKLDDIDLVVNSTYSNTHYSITKEFLEKGFNVLVEKPFGRTRYECDDLIKTAKDNNVVLAVFQQSFYAPYYQFTLEKINEGILGDIKQVSLRYNSFQRRWDWQTLQKKCAGGLYNSGPHPVGFALGFLGFDKNTEVVFSRLGLSMTSGDADDYAKVILTAPGKPVVDLEVISSDAYNDYCIKIIGSRGTLKCNTGSYKLTYIVDGENPERPVQEDTLRGPNGEPKYCSEQLIKHTEEGNFGGSAFDVGTKSLYEQLYFKITEGRPMDVTPEMARDIVNVIETVHAQNPLPMVY
ncbi:MAG: Gfo/Idh/MocA family oxidoreductase [Clostridia bacterium]|nr:Gfo/Idh/MocA family oxidoreductase [Clostridia bacterium]